MRKTSVLAAALAHCLTVACAHASADFIDTFESYTQTSQMFALGAWGDFNAFPVTGLALQTSGGHPGKYVYHPGGQTMRHQLSPPISTSPGQPIVWEFDFLVQQGAINNANRRITNGLRVEGTTTILEMGIHNSNLDPETGFTVAGYAVRTVSIGGTPNNWVTFPGFPPIHLGWNHFRATIHPTQILFELDFEADGVFDTSRLVTTNDTSGIAWNSLRIGGPSDLSSPNDDGAGFDNVHIRVVPELCPGDINHSGTVNIDDLVSVITAWGPCPTPPTPCPADVNANGQVNIDDLVTVITGWGACP